MPDEIDFREGVRGLHHISPASKVLMPVAKHDMEPNEAPK